MDDVVDNAVGTVVAILPDGTLQQIGDQVAETAAADPILTFVQDSTEPITDAAQNAAESVTTTLTETVQSAVAGEGPVATTVTETVQNVVAGEGPVATVVDGIQGSQDGTLLQTVTSPITNLVGGLVETVTGDGA